MKWIAVHSQRSKMKMALAGVSWAWLGSSFFTHEPQWKLSAFLHHLCVLCWQSATVQIDGPLAPGLHWWLDPEAQCELQHFSGGLFSKQWESINSHSMLIHPKEGSNRKSLWLILNRWLQRQWIAKWLVWMPNWMVWAERGSRKHTPFTRWPDPKAAAPIATVELWQPLCSEFDKNHESFASLSLPASLGAWHWSMNILSTHTASP